jgi:hypothetical protein
MHTCICRSHQLLGAGAPELKVRSDAVSQFVSDCRRCSCLCYFHHLNVKRYSQPSFIFRVLLQNVLFASWATSSVFGRSLIAKPYVVSFSLYVNPVLTQVDKTTSVVCRTAANATAVFSCGFKAYKGIKADKHNRLCVRMLLTTGL